MLLASAVVVWEWLNEHGRWRPYSPAVCHHIEAVIRSDPRCGSVVLGQVDSRLSPYIIDLHSMHQFRQDTGEEQGGETHGGEGCSGAAGPEVEASTLLLCVCFIYPSLTHRPAPPETTFIYVCFYFTSSNLVSH